MFVTHPMKIRAVRCLETSRINKPDIQRDSS